MNDEKKQFEIISRNLLGEIVDQVFDGAIEDTKVIEDIYKVIAQEIILPMSDANELLLSTLMHLEHNARKSGANMGLALDAAKYAIDTIKVHK